MHRSNFDFFGSRGAALRKISHFGRNDCKSASLFTGTRCFHSGIQRQNIGLNAMPSIMLTISTTARADCVMVSMVFSILPITSPPAGQHCCFTRQIVCMAGMFHIQA
jgi:hypothetical protein